MGKPQHLPLPEIVVTSPPRGLYGVLQHTLPALEALGYHELGRPAEVAAVEWRNLQPCEGCNDHVLQLVKAELFIQYPQEVLYIHGPFVFQPLRGQVLSIDPVPVVGVGLEPVVGLCEHPLAGAADGHHGHPHLLDLGERAGVDRV